MKACLLFISILLINNTQAQSIHDKLVKATTQFEADPQLKHGTYSLLVIDAQTGNVLFDKNSQTGMATASCLKIVTSATAFELLGKDYRYKTDFANADIPNNNAHAKNLYIIPHGDPTFGSWRYAATKEDAIYKEISTALNTSGIHINSQSNCTIINKGFSKRYFPEGWIWQDIGNYYGAGQGALNWRENQFDIISNTGANEGDKPNIVKLVPSYTHIHLNTDELKAGKKGSGDYAYVYLDPAHSDNMYITGTMPPGEKSFEISATHPNPVAYFSDYLQASARASKDSLFGIFNRLQVSDSIPSSQHIFFTHYSPAMDSIVYWFMKKSINLYGEALLKTMALEKKGFGSTEDGVDIVQDFWQQKGIEKTALNIIDGSGLSPATRVTTDALVKILQYAQKQPWYKYYYEAFPEYNGMKLKSGTIGGVKGFCGYHTAKDGKQYIIAFLVNNYNGGSGTLVNKMYEVLNVLK